MTNQKALLFFVHGLGGSAADTWGDFPRLINEDCNLSAIFDTGFFEYPTSLFRFPFTKSALRIQDLANGLRTELKIRYSEYSNILLICHSLGGLIARRYLLDEIKDQNQLKCRNLLLYAVPHNGSGLADIGSLISWRHDQLRQLCIGSDFINDLNLDWFRLNVPNTIKSKFIVAGQDRVVDRDSAKLFWGNLDVETILNRGHIDVVKPVDPKDLAFLILRQFALETLGSQEVFGWKSKRRAQASDEERVRIGRRIYIRKDVFPALVIPDDTVAGITSTIFIEAEGALIDLSVSVKISHTYIGDLVITLMSPSGTKIYLQNREGGSMRSGEITETFDIDSHPELAKLIGQDIGGNWQLHIVDSAVSDFGTLEKWGIHLCPTCEDISK